MPPRTLSVHPNPYCALDADGDPCGVVPRADLRSILIGARLDLERSSDERQKYLFDVETLVELPDDPAHRNALRSGDLLPADERTARLCGLTFLPLAQQLELAKKGAAARWLAETGVLPPFAAAPIDPPAAPAPAPSAPASAPTSTALALSPASSPFTPTSDAAPQAD